jgi:hypothetical protein
MVSTFLTSIPAALILYDPVLNDTRYILGGGDDTRVTLGALLEIFLMIGNVGTAVVMFPILRRPDRQGFRPSSILDDARYA